ncbi:MAG TPA: cytochrome P450 [Gemmataceae bacterium]|jgi:cytochrome P450|nr:cytochrome P450 [Gemmataceae bacterium]
MIDLFSVEMRRNPYPAYEQMRNGAPVFRLPPFDLWLIFDFEGVKRVLVDHDVFSSDLSHASGNGNPGEWFIFFDPPRHTKLRALISKAFTPRVVANLEQRIRELSRQLLDQTIERGEMDLAADFAVPLPMLVIAEMLGVPVADWPRYKRWSDVILKLANTFSRDEEAVRTVNEYGAVTAEMRLFLPDVIAQRRAAHQDDLLTRLVEAEVDGERLTQAEILGFMQLLLVGGQETTANLLNNAVLCFLENPDQLARLRAAPDLLPSAIEEVLRYRAPVQWMPRATRRDVKMHGQVIPAGKLVLPLIGSANRDPKQFRDAGRFDITRDPNPHLAFGHGIHSCLGAPLARLEARIALADFLERVNGFALVSDEPWEPRKALNVHGPSRLPIRFTPGRRAAAPA